MLNIEYNRNFLLASPETLGTLDVEEGLDGREEPGVWDEAWDDDEAVLTSSVKLVQSLKAKLSSGIIGRSLDMGSALQ